MADRNQRIIGDLYDRTSVFEKSFLATFGGFSDESLTTVVETFLRSRSLLNPQTYSRSLRIRRIEEGAARFDSSVYGVFACVCKRKLPGFITNALVALKNVGVNVFVVNNGKATPEVRARLLELCHTYIERANIGRDFGGYKDALQLIFPLNPSKLLLLNDSLYYFPTGVEEMLRRLIASEADVAGISDNHENHYHIQSFAMAFNPRIINHPRFRQYWKKYLPISTRRWAIHQGEVGLTQYLVKRIGITVDIIYTPQDLYKRLENASEQMVFEVASLMPARFRGENAHALIASADRLLNRELINYSRRFGTSQTQHATDEERKIREELTAIGKMTAGLQYGKAAYIKNELLYTICNYIGFSNGIAFGGFPFIRYMGTPLFKRDIVFRGLYTITEVGGFLDSLDLPPALRTEIIDDLRAKGYGLWLKGIKKFMYNVGLM